MMISLAMTQNPFETPLAPGHVATSTPLSQGRGTFELGTCLSEAWEATWANFPTWLGVAIVGSLLMTISIFTLIGGILVTPVLMWGAVYYTINMHDRRAQFSDLFAGFSKYGQALGGMLGVGFAIIGVSLIGQSVSFIGTALESGALIGLGGLVNLVWAFMVTVRLYFAPFYIVDQNMTVVDALKESWRVTGEQKMNTALLAIVAGIVSILGIIALLVGVLVSVTVAYLMWASAYRQIVGSRST